MKQEDLFRAIGEIGEDLIADSENTKAAPFRTGAWKRLLPLAACFVAAVGIGLAASQSGKPSASGGIAAGTQNGGGVTAGGIEEAADADGGAPLTEADTDAGEAQEETNPALLREILVRVDRLQSDGFAGTVINDLGLTDENDDPLFSTGENLTVILQDNAAAIPGNPNVQDYSGKPNTANSAPPVHGIVRVSFQSFEDGIDQGSQPKIYARHVKQCPDASFQEEIGLYVYAQDATESGLTLLFAQNGDTGTELDFGESFVLQRHHNGGWEDMEIAFDGNWAFKQTGYLIAPDDVTEHDYAWERLYGKLPPGDYRIGVNVNSIKSPGDFKQYMMYAEFRLP